MNRSFNPLWCEKYRPATVAECILPKDTKQTFQQYVDNKLIMNTLVSGPPGMGKTTVLKAAVKEIESDYLFMNGSLKGIEMLRNEIQEFASAVSFSGGRKYVIIDEADNLTDATQKGLRSFIESYSNTGYLLTCNYPHRIEEALRSRLAHVEFRIPKEEKPTLAKECFARACMILQAEGVTYDKAVVVEVIKRYFPDFRKVLVELQRYASQTNNNIDTGMLAKMTVDISNLVALMKDKNYTGVRKWIGENGENDTMIYRKFYDKAAELVTPESIPPMVLVLAEYEYRSAFVADKEINMAAAFAQIMTAVVFR